jgi:hypothetical protein
MPVQAKVFDKDGNWIDEIGSVFTRSWILNDEGLCTFEIALDDSKCTLANLEFGNYLVVQATSILTNTALPIWGGIIDTPRQWHDLTMTVNAYTVDHMLKTRIAPRRGKIHDHVCTVFRAIVDYSNKEYKTLTRNSTRDVGGKHIDANFNYDKLLDKIKKYQENTLNDWSIEPVIAANGQLYFEANWYQKKGTVRTFRLEEGHNIELVKNPLTEDGEIINYKIGTSNAPTVEDRKKDEHLETDLTSIARYGCRQAYEQYDTKNDTRITNNVIADITKGKNPRRTFCVSALDVGETFANIALGDTLPLKLNTVGWNANGTRGVNINVRVIGIAYADNKQKLELTLDEAI